LARKILLADDSVTAQNMGRKILADAGYEVITVNNGSAALKKVAEARPDVIVLDVYMPGYSGLEVCQRLKEVNETARIPILLTVGKLEPFKPEEAKRAKADGFIVKPFEASELLSALAKLEDKIVPRPEPSKPGRFARAIAAVEEGRYDKTMAVEEDSGWKDRIAFPSKKKSKVVEPEDGDDPAIYNPPNKDLRTIVDHPHAHPPQAVRSEDPKMNLGALAPHGLPKDVTPEEIAALAAAAAQIKGSGSGKHEPEGRVADTHPAEQRVAQGRIAENRFSEEHVRPPQIAEPAPPLPVAAQPAVADVRSEDKSAEDKAEVKQEQPAVETPKEVAAPAPVAEVVAEPKAEEKEKPEAPAVKSSDAENEVPNPAALTPAEAMAAMTVPEPVPFTSTDHASGSGSGDGSSAYLPADEPVTMAAAAGAEFSSSESRWMAVPVSLLPEESAISLEQEMQKNFAALAAAEMAHAAQPEPVAETQPVAAMAPPVEAPVAETPAPAPVTSAPEVAETPPPVTSTPELAETMSSVASEAAEAIQAAVKEFETVAAQLAEVQPAAAPEPEPAPVRISEPVAERAPEPVEEPVVEAPPVVEAKVEEKVEEKVEAKIEAKVEDKPVVESAAAEPEAKQEEVRAQDVLQPAPQEQEAEKKAEEPQPQVEAVAATPAEISSSAETPETAAPDFASAVLASEVPAEPSLASQDSPQMTEAPAKAEPAAGGIEDMAKKEKEIAATTAAAWASWRRIRDTGDGKAEPPSKTEEAAPAPDQAAMAVAAGAEKAPEEAPAESGSESAEIASIVDSVLADMRPKIVEEISRKMGKKKK